MKKFVIFLIILFISLYSFGQQKYFEYKQKIHKTHEFLTVKQFSENNFVIAESIVPYTGGWASSISEIKNAQVFFHEDDSAQNVSLFYDVEQLNDSIYIFFGNVADLDVNLSTDGLLFLYMKTYNIYTKEINTYDFRYDSLRTFFHPKSIINDNHIYIAGASMINTVNANFDLANGGGRELYLIKMNFDLEIVWDTIYSQFNHNNDFTTIIPSDNGGIYGLATIEDWWNQPPGQILLCEIDSGGNFVREKLFDIGEDDRAYGLTQCIDNGMLFTGVKNASSSIDRVSVIYKLDANWDIEWVDDVYFNNGISEKCLQLDDENFILIAEYYTNNSYHLQGAILKIDKNGNKIWQRDYGGEQHEYLHDVIFNNKDSTGQSGYVIAGRRDSLYYISQGTYGGSDGWLLKVNCMGLMDKPESNFNYSIENESVVFENTSNFVYPDSLDGGYYTWYFGTGDSLIINTDSLLNFSYNYYQAGIYQTKLKSIVCNDTSIYAETICIGEFDSNIDLSYLNQNDIVVTSTDNNMVSFHFPTLNIFDEIVSINFGDGNSINIADSLFSYQHEYDEANFYEVTITAIACNQNLTYSFIVNAGYVNVLENNLFSQVQIFPNPFTTYLEVNSVTFRPNLSLKIYNFIGNIIYYKYNIDQNQIIVTDNFSKGVYFYRLENEIGKVLQSGKLIKY